MNPNAELPITNILILSDRTKCPPNYTVIWRSQDTNSETDLWKDSLFGKKINRYICFTKEFPINGLYKVIEDIKLTNERENIISGFIPIERCYDSSEKSFQKKLLSFKQSDRYFTPMAVSDIIILARNKRPPLGYSLVGEINSHTICIKITQVQNGKYSPMSHSGSVNNMSGTYQNMPPPIPPRPLSQGHNLNDPSFVAVEQSYVHVNTNNDPNNKYGAQQSSDFYGTAHRGGSFQTQTSNSHYNPLSGVPFQLNPIYDNMNRSKDKDLDLERLNRTLEKSNELLENLNYNFNLERTCMQNTSL